jgi:hypothetical protein
MTTTNAIMNFAARQSGPFKRRDLLNSLLSDPVNVSEVSVVVQLNRLLADGRLVRVGRGRYTIPSHIKKEYVFLPTEQICQISQFIKERFPFIDYCIWHSTAFTPFMQHVPSGGSILIDVERIAMEQVFLSMQENDWGLTVILTPSAQECERYISNRVQIIIRPLVKEAPINVVDGCPVPKIEKMLVDAISDKELLFVQGAELYTVYGNAFSDYTVSKRGLLRYASRRNRKDKAEQILNTLKL